MRKLNADELQDCMKSDEIILVYTPIKTLLNLDEYEDNAIFKRKAKDKWNITYTSTKENYCPNCGGECNCKEEITSTRLRKLLSNIILLEDTDDYYLMPNTDTLYSVKIGDSYLTDGYYVD